MREIILIKYGEIILKGLNRGKFEDILLRNMRRALLKNSYDEIRVMQAVVYVTPAGGADIDNMVQRLSRVFGILSVARVLVCEKKAEVILEKGCEYVSAALDSCKTFKVEAKRSDKTFELTSPQICAQMGEAILNANPHLEVDVIKPDTIVRVEIRDKEAYVYADAARILGPGGMPTGSGGKATLLLSGGIDSPVAGYMMAKRGVTLDAVHFFSPPYTSEAAKEKVIDLARILARYTGVFSLYIVPFTEQQLAIRDNCPEEHLTLIMRRMMMAVAEKLARQNKDIALITGESLGQVASQTMHALAVTNDAVSIPIFRPLIGMDKEEIISIARKIGTFETSILPYEDCCTVFVPRHPTTRPSLEKILESQAKIPFEKLTEKAFMETTWVKVEG
ncbi:MAG: tRNA uracil 4-sulfurtransferase ThiI [Clostridia bacterium]|nr:tRNA uracil 4-sulfurtransferase ThiI [Clostridia bacterium]